MEGRGGDKNHGPHHHDEGRSRDINWSWNDDAI